MCTPPFGKRDISDTAEIVQLQNAKDFRAVVEKNILTALGRPGSVDKGEREERGVRLAISTRGSVDRLRSTTTLQIKHDR
ncbi:MAG: hypothetical protein AB7W44_03045 [Pyrinomonadaceae bacterium]